MQLLCYPLNGCCLTVNAIPVVCFTSLHSKDQWSSSCNESPLPPFPFTVFFLFLSLSSDPTMRSSERCKICSRVANEAIHDGAINDFAAFCVSKCHRRFYDDFKKTGHEMQSQKSPGEIISFLITVFSSSYLYHNFLRISEFSVSPQGADSARGVPSDLGLASVTLVPPPPPLRPLLGVIGLDF